MATDLVSFATRVCLISDINSRSFGMDMECRILIFHPSLFRDGLILQLEREIHDE
jgi:hypothetical protein